MNTHNNSKALIIGGFAFNIQPVTGLTEIFPNHKFIDINQYSANQTYFSIVYSIVDEIEAYKPQFVIAYSMGGLFALGAFELLIKPRYQLIIINGSPCFKAQNNWLGIKEADFNLLKAKLISLKAVSFMSYLTRLFAYPKINYDSKHSAKLKKHNWHKEHSLQLVSKVQNNDPETSIFLCAGLKSWWSYSSQHQLLNLLDIFFTTDLRDISLKHSPQTIWINGALDNLVKLNNLPGRQIIALDSSHLTLNPKEISLILIQIIAETSNE